MSPMLGRVVARCRSPALPTLRQARIRSTRTPSMTTDNEAQSYEPTDAAGDNDAGAALAKINEVLEQRAPPPASQSAHALWMGGLVAVVFLAGARGIGADTPVVTLVSVAGAGGLIFAISWFEERAAKRAHGLGRKEMARELKALLKG